jgi:hypothetical protein
MQARQGLTLSDPTQEQENDIHARSSFVDPVAAFENGLRTAS